MAVVTWNPIMPSRPFQQPWSPFEGLESLRAEMDRLFDAFGGRTPPSGIRESVWTPRVDLLEHEQEFVLMADLPGMKQEDLHISVQENILTLEGTRAVAHADNGQDKYQYRERASGTFCRRFQLSTAVDAEHITATYKDGVLEVHLPKVAAAQPKRITVQASS
jgi:HSP20 family protein